jgi:dipeptidyl aminopeptidase/acylaminoacyl peptidase
MRSLIAAFFTALPAVAGPEPASVLRILQSTVELHDVALSRDGARVGWVEQVPTPDGPSPDESIVQILDRTASSATPVRLTAGKDGKAHDEHDLDFSPDGKSLAFLSDAAQPHQLQLYVADLGSGTVRQLTTVSGHLSKPRFRPDGREISVLFIEGGADEQGPLKPAARRTGVVDEQVKEQRLALVPADGSAPLRAVSPADLFLYEYDWRPDGAAVAATGAHGSGDDNWWIAKLFSIDTRTGAARVVHSPSLQICEPTFSPDGSRIAFIEGLMSDAGANGGDIFVVPADGSSKPRNLTAGLRGTPSTLRWLKPGEILFGLQIEGTSAFASVPAAGGKPAVLWRGAENVHMDWSVGASFSADGSVSAAVRESFDRAPEVIAGALGTWQPVTQRNAALRPVAGAARSLRWKSDAFDVQGWLLTPREPPALGTKAPMVVIVHGGPASAVRPSWSQTALLLASQGYYVLMPNPRGSFGGGEAFTRANVKDFGYGDLRDIVRGVDAAVRVAPVDPKRVGIYGHSYGGYMTMWAVTRTHRFAAAVASAGIADWQSYYGQNRIDQWMLPYFGKSVYEDPQVYARSSPISFIRNVRTPTLVLHGERDAEVPLPQGYEFWHALKALGVETQLVVYEDEGHRIQRPDHVRDRVERIVGWFDSHLKGSPVRPAR